MIHEAIDNYFRNREDFYSVLLPRIPNETLRDRLQEAVKPICRPSGTLEAPYETPDMRNADEFLSALELRDMLKKAGFGATFGRTTISFEEALNRAEFIEETGVLLFEHCAAGGHVAVFRQEAKHHRLALAAVLRLGDNLRYRKS